VSSEKWNDSKSPEGDWYDSKLDWIDSSYVREFDKSFQTRNDTIHNWIDSLCRWYDSKEVREHQNGLKAVWIDSTFVSYDSTEVREQCNISKTHEMQLFKKE